MSDVTAIAGKVAGIISLVAFLPYIIAILRSKTKPNRATWFIWTVVGLMLSASYYVSGANHTMWVPMTYAICPFFILILSIKYGKGGWTWLDRFCLFGTGLSLLLWWVFSSPIIALLINIFIDFLGAVPTVKKAYLEPETEDRTAWSLSLVGNIVNLFAIENWMFAIVIYPLSQIITIGLIVMLVFLRRSSTKERR